MTKRLRMAVPFILIWVLAMALPVAPAYAQDGVTVLAEGFNAPQGVLVAPDGSVWVIDSGVGGDTEFTTIDPSGQEVTATYGETSRIVKIDADGTQTEISLLPSVFMSDEAVGGARLALVDGELYATSGVWIGDGTENVPPENPNIAAVVKINEDGSLDPVAATWRIERRMNPDNTIYESHPYGLAADAEGNLWVADAGANTLLRLNPNSSIVELVTTFPPLPGVFPNPLRGGEMLTDPVPTGIAFDDDGNAYVSLLSGAPFVPGSTKVVKVTPSGARSDYATGLTMLTDIRRGPDGAFYAVQFAEFTDRGPTPNSGALVKIGEGETSTPVIEGLSFPTSVDFDADGNAYVTINGVGAPGSGAVVKYAGVTSGVTYLVAEEAAAEEAEATETPVAEEEAEATPTPVAEEEEVEATETPVAEEEAEATPTPVAEEEEAEATETPVAEEEAAATETPVAEEEAEATPTPVAEEEEAAEAAMADGPSVTVSDQASDGAMVTVDQVVAAQSGWMVIHADEGGSPGPVLGQTAVAPGTTDNIIVILDEPLAGESSLWAMLHVDEGTSGTYEFPGADVPVEVDGAIVMAPFVATAPEAEMAEEAPAALMDLVDTAAANSDFSTLVAAVQAAGLVDVLKGEGPFTVFAPTNAAFAALPAGTIDALLADPQGDLFQILLYHVVDGQVMAADVTDGLSVDSVQGGPLTFTVDGDTVMVNDVTIIATDIEATNGVIHVIDAVLLPPAEATPEATEEAMEEATPEATEEAMEEVTPEATEEAMEEATPEATEEAMEEATPEATEEAAEEAAPAGLPNTGGALPSPLSIATLLTAALSALGGAYALRRRR